MRFKLSAAAAALLLTAMWAPIGTAQSNRTAAQSLPPLVYVCPMVQDAEVLEEHAGKCPKCGMELQPVRLDSKWWCPTHQTLVVSDKPGTCPRDGKALVQVTLAMTWACPDDPNKKYSDPGKCANGQERKVGYDVRAHGDHNPRHDGQFFMAKDAWHHIEGAYPSAGLFKVFFYDNFTKPISGKPFTGTLAVYDAKSPVDKELGSFPFALARDGMTMEAKIPPAFAGLPLKAAAKMKFDPKLEVQRFDFAFSAYSKDTAPVVPPAAPATTAATRPPTTTAAAAPKPAAPAAPRPTPTPPARTPASTAAAAAPTPAPQAPPPQAPAAAPAPLILDSPLQMPPGLAEALDESKLPHDVPGLLGELATRAGEVEKLVNEGSLAQVWLPAVGTKTVALMLDGRSGTLPAAQRAAATGAVKRVVTAAWELDAYGDLGDRAKISDAYKRLAAAVTDLKAAYGAR